MPSASTACTSRFRAAKYPSDRDVAAFCDRILERVRALPGVVSAGLVNRLPLAGGAQTGRIEFEGIDPKAADLGERRLPVGHARLLPHARDSAARRPRRSPSADTEARRRWRSSTSGSRRRCSTVGDPIGRRVRIPVMNLPWLTIVGVAGHIRHDRARRGRRGRRCISTTSSARRIGWRSPFGRTAIPARWARRWSPPSASVDPEQPVYDARTLEAVVDRSRGAAMAADRPARSVRRDRAAAREHRRLRRDCVRGRTAQPRVRHPARARRAPQRDRRSRHAPRRAAVRRGRGDRPRRRRRQRARVRSLLFKITAFDLVSFGASTAILFVVALAACGLPARRAAGVDPSVALRAE